MMNIVLYGGEIFLPVYMMTSIMRFMSADAEVSPQLIMYNSAPPNDIAGQNHELASLAVRNGLSGCCMECRLANMRFINMRPDP